MARSKIKLTNDPKQDLEILFKECSNNNQICYHLKKHEPLVLYLKQKTGLDKEPMVLLYHYKEDIKDVPKCICGRERQYHCYGYRPTCSRKKCQNIVREESKKEFCLKNYGVEFVTQLETMKEKSRQTCLEKFGVDNCTKSPEIIKKRKEKNFLKYGVEEPIALSSVRGKTITDAERGFIKIQEGLPDGYTVIESDKNYYYKIKCSKGHLFEISKSVLYLRKKDNTEICNECNEYKGSLGEQEVFEYIQSFYNKNISRSNRRLISPYEIDIVLEDIKLCIEFNGDYWHSIKINDDKYYHQTKLKRCVDLGYDLLQIRENDWNKNKEVVKRKLYNKIMDLYDQKDLELHDDLLIFDLSWYDSRIIMGLEDFLVENIEPKIVKIGQYDQWDCGKFIYKIK
jgi:very-short-patch-repair endonuclease